MYCYSAQYAMRIKNSVGALNGLWSLICSTYAIVIIMALAWVMIWKISFFKALKALMADSNFHMQVGQFSLKHNFSFPCDLMNESYIKIPVFYPNCQYQAVRNQVFLRTQLLQCTNIMLFPVWNSQKNIYLYLHGQLWASQGNRDTWPLFTLVF